MKWKKKEGNEKNVNEKRLNREPLYIYLDFSKYI